MPRAILKLNEKWYIEWTTVCDAPCSFGMTKDIMQEHVKESIANRNPDMIESEINRAAQIIFDRIETFGTSLPSRTEDAESMIGNFNRAGGSETFLPIPEIIRIYCDEQREPNLDEGEKLPHEEGENETA